MPLSMNAAIFWDVTTCNLMQMYRRFGSRCCLHKIRQKNAAGLCKYTKEEAFAFWGYVAQVGSSLLTFRNNLPAPHSRTKRSKSFILECLAVDDRSDRLSRNFGNHLSTDDA